MIKTPEEKSGFVQIDRERLRFRVDRRTPSSFDVADLVKMHRARQFPDEGVRTLLINLVLPEANAVSIHARG